MVLWTSLNLMVLKCLVLIFLTTGLDLMDRLKDLNWMVLHNRFKFNGSQNKFKPNKDLNRMVLNTSLNLMFNKGSLLMVFKGLVWTVLT